MPTYKNMPVFLLLLPTVTHTHAKIVFISGSAFSIHVRNHREINAERKNLTIRTYSVQSIPVGAEDIWDDVKQR